MFSPLLKFLIFKSSTAMTAHLEKKNVSLEIEYLPDHKFIKKLIEVCADVFCYRIQISPDHFISLGYSERKMVLALDLYDIVKQVRSQSKIQAKLEFRDPKW